MKKMLLIFILLLNIVPVYTQVVDIIDLHHNDANGVPVAPYGIGAAATVEGVVTCGTRVFSSTNFEIYLQDETAGINAFQYQSMPAEVEEGDRVRITGKIKQYRGLTEVSDISQVRILQRGEEVPAPLLVTCNDVANTFQADYSEPNESRLIRINNVQVVSGSGPVYTLEDESGQCLLYIDGDTNLEPPHGEFDVIGILKQYDSSEPYTDGYEIVPRFAGDFIVGAGPVFTSQPREIRIAQRSVVFEWRTENPAAAVFYYAELDAPLPETGIDISEHSARHEFQLDGLTPATIYHGLVKAADASGERQSKALIFSTASSQSSGDIKVYFNQSVDASVKWRTPANSGYDLSEIMISHIDNARYSIDAAFYSFTHDDIRNALIQAHNRGIKVRFIYESDNYNSDIGQLKSAGIPVISDVFGDNDGSGYMHDKFLIVDARDGRTPADACVVTGSANATYSGAVSNAENVLVINDEALANAYTLEFNEMWGSDTDAPNADASRFGPRKRENTPHRFNIGGVWVEQYMSPSDATEKHIIDAIHTADRGLFFCIFSFTSNGIENAMKELYLNDADFILRGVFDAGAVNNTGSAYDPMRGQGPGAWSRPADIFTDKVPVTSPYTSLHHKYMLIDGSFRDYDPIVVTGSHNWSYSANTRNDENTLIIYDADIANQYYQEFAARYREAGGQGDVTVNVDENGTSPRTLKLAQNFPNPFNATTVILASAPSGSAARNLALQITDVLGRVIKTLHHDAASGDVRFEWDGTNESGRPVGSGVYLATLVGVQSPRVIKMIYLR